MMNGIIRTIGMHEMIASPIQEAIIHGLIVAEFRSLKFLIFQSSKMKRELQPEMAFRMRDKDFLELECSTLHWNCHKF